MRINFSFLLVLLCSLANAQKPNVRFGSIHFFNSISETPIKVPVAVWLPTNYTKDRQYPVLYMHDGQMLFDGSSTWNKQEWLVEEAMTDLIRTDSAFSAIVVGIWNSGENRFQDYFPQKVFELLSPEEQDSISVALLKIGRIKDTFRPASDAYLAFVVDTLKPFIDRNFSTLTGRKSTFMAGSSMGGLISLYALSEYPDVFGGIACFSTHWTGIHRNDNNPFPKAMMQYLTQKLPSAAQGHRIYLDTGTETLDSLYKNHHEAACSLIKAKGYTQTNFQHSVKTGENHSEIAWSKRFPNAIRFLFRRD